MIIFSKFKWGFCLHICLLFFDHYIIKYSFYNYHIIQVVFITNLCLDNKLHSKNQVQFQSLVDKPGIGHLRFSCFWSIRYICFSPPKPVDLMLYLIDIDLQKRPCYTNIGNILFLPKNKIGEQISYARCFKHYQDIQGFKHIREISCVVQVGTLFAVRCSMDGSQNLRISWGRLTPNMNFVTQLVHLLSH